MLKSAENLEAKYHFSNARLQFKFSFGSKHEHLAQKSQKTFNLHKTRQVCHENGRLRRNFECAVDS